MDHSNENVAKRTMSYVNEVYRLIKAKPEVQDIVILNHIGNPIKTTMEVQQTLAFCGTMEALMEKMEAASREMFPDDGVLLFRIRTTHNETLIAPDGKITVIVIQAAKDRNPIDALIG